MPKNNQEENTEDVDFSNSTILEVAKYLGNDIRIYKTRLMSKYEWYNTRLKRFVRTKYLTRTKYKKQVPYILYSTMGNQPSIYVHKDHYDNLVKKLEDYIKLTTND